MYVFSNEWMVMLYMVAVWRGSIQGCTFENTVSNVCLVSDVLRICLWSVDAVSFRYK